MLSFFQNTKTQAEFFNALVIYTLVVILMSFLLRYFWNNALVKHVTILKPVNTLFDSLMLAIGISLIA